MAKSIKKYDNGLHIRFMVKIGKYFITYGENHIKVDGKYLEGFKSVEEADALAVRLARNVNKPHEWTKL